MPITRAMVRWEVRSLYRLPNELVGEVSKFLVDPHDVVNFACACRTNRAILDVVRTFNGRYQEPEPGEPENGSVVHGRMNSARMEPILRQHQRLRRDFWGFRITYATWIWGNVPRIFSIRTINMLSSIIANPRIGYYIQHLFCQTWHQSWSYSPTLRFNNVSILPVQVFEHLPYSITQFNALRSELVDVIRPEHVAHWIRKLEEGSEDAVVALLLLKSPNIRTLVFHEWNGAVLWKALMQEMDGHIKPTVIPILSNLNAVALSLCHTWDIVELVAFAGSLPTTRVIRVAVQSRHFHMPGQGPPIPVLPPATSNVTDLRLEHCDLAPLELTNILTNTRNLERFTFLNFYRWPLDLMYLYNLILLAARHSLSHLSLRKRGAPVLPPLLSIHDFREFSNLQILEIGLNMIHQTNIPEGQAVMRSFRRLILRGVTDDMHDHAKRVIDYVFKTRWINYPELSRIEVHAQDGLTPAVLGTYGVQRGLCRTRFIDLQICDEPRPQ